MFCALFMAAQFVEMRDLIPRNEALAIEAEVSRSLAHQSPYTASELSHFEDREQEYITYLRDSLGLFDKVTDAQRHKKTIERIHAEIDAASRRHDIYVRLAAIKRSRSSMDAFAVGWHAARLRELLGPHDFATGVIPVPIDRLPKE